MGTKFFAKKFCILTKFVPAKDCARPSKNQNQNVNSNQSTQSNRKRFIDVFSGAGGTSLGFSKFFDPVLAIDLDPDCVASYNANLSNRCLQKDLRNHVRVPKAEIVIGGLPQIALFPNFLEIVRQANAKIFVLEVAVQHLRQIKKLLTETQILPKQYNLLYVQEVTSCTYKKRNVQRQINPIYTQGFRCLLGSLGCLDYGVPQTRRCAFVVGSRVGIRTPDFFSSERGKGVGWRTVKDAIGDLRGNKTDPFDPLHKIAPLEISLELLRKFGETDVLGQLRWDQPAKGIRPEFYRQERGCCLHPNRNRPITLREAARLQTFPDDFVFKGFKSSVARQIRNACPPRLAEFLASCVADCFVD